MEVTAHRCKRTSKNRVRIQGTTSRDNEAQIIPWETISLIQKFCEKSNSRASENCEQEGENFTGDMPVKQRVSELHHPVIIIILRMVHRIDCHVIKTVKCQEQRTY